MGSAVWMSLWAWIILDSGVCSVSLPEITDGKFIDECVSEHNRARSSVSPAASDMLYMTWDAGLAITARAWARHCLFEHNTYLDDARRVHPTFSSVGENIWAGYPPSFFNVASAVKKWVDEKQEYDYNSNRCTKVCGHYTQVVWAGSYKVGCAAQLCPNGVKSTNFDTEEGVIFVCNYALAGNVIGRKPYLYGPCSKCDGICEGNLCRNPKRDSQKSYNWTPDWDPAKVNSDNAAEGSSYVAVLVVRPIALIATFIAAYAVRHFYPDVFCYE
ncbi:GLIPR1-like protein 1 [Pagrus major]|uniref:GLIPR1-like protein 1 n=1 Tax=Pagrus major TaxID=143350 RepID=UPI003CC8D994